MIYQVRANLYFESEDEARDFYHDCVMAMPKATTVNPDQINSEYSIAELIENHHDDTPSSPCDVVERIISG